MFRIDRNLVKISPARFTTVTQAQEVVQEVIREESCDTPENISAHNEPVLSEGPTEEEQARERAAEIIRRAEEKAADMLSDAERQAEELRRAVEAEIEAVTEQARAKAREAGYEEGRAEAVQVAQAEMKAELEAKFREDDETLRRVIDVIQTERMKMIGDIEGEVIKLTLAVAEKIIKLASENDDTIFETMILNALRQMNLEGKITIRVGVREYDRFFSSGSAVFSLGDGTTVTASVLKDPSMNDGDCIIDSDSGTINAGVDSQLKYIELAFNKADGE